MNAGKANRQARCRETSGKSSKVGKEVHVHAQTHAINFYEKLGFTPYGDTYLESNIKRVSMVKPSETKFEILLNEKYYNVKLI